MELYARQHLHPGGSRYVFINDGLARDTISRMWEEYVFVHDVQIISRILREEWRLRAFHFVHHVRRVACSCVCMPAPCC